MLQVAGWQVYDESLYCDFYFDSLSEENDHEHFYGYLNDIPFDYNVGPLVLPSRRFSTVANACSCIE